MGRAMESARGFFELLVPLYSSQGQNSALSLAVSAVASEIMFLWRHGDSFQAPEEAYNQALRCLRRTLQNPNECGKPATILAVISLQFYENLEAIYGRRSASRVHHDGAVSLLPFADLDDNDRLASAYIRKYIFHTEMSSAIRQGRPLQSIMYSPFIKSNGPTAEPDNPSFALDAIGASVAELQASYFQPMTQDDSTFSTQHGFKNWRAEAKRIDQQLLAWARNVPKHWRPQKLTSGLDIDASIPTYQGVCEAYPSCQIGTIWNLWRVQRLILSKIVLSSLRTPLIPGPFDLTDDEMSTRDKDFVKYQNTLQEMADSICHSVPFYLGNQAGPLSLAHFTDPNVVLPSDFVIGTSSLGLSNKGGSIEHRSHIIAQGPWHVMSPLSRLLTFFLEDDGHLMADVLRPGQYEWIREQFLRVIIMLNIPLTDTSGGSSSQASIHTRVEILAKRVRKSAVFMSGP